MATTLQKRVLKHCPCKLELISVWHTFLLAVMCKKKKLQQVDLWFPEVNFIPTGYGSNTMESYIKSQVCNTICSKGFAGHTARSAKPGQWGHSAALNLPSHGWAPHSGVLPFHKCPAAPWGHLHSGDSWDTPGFQLLAVRLHRGFSKEQIARHMNTIIVHLDFMILKVFSILNDSFISHPAFSSRSSIAYITCKNWVWIFVYFLCYRYFQILPFTLSMVVVKSDCYQKYDGNDHHIFSFLVSFFFYYFTVSYLINAIWGTASHFSRYCKCCQV